MFENTLLKTISDILNTSFFSQLEYMTSEEDTCLYDLYTVYIEGQFITDIDIQIMKDIISILKYIEENVSDDIFQYLNSILSSDTHLSIFISKRIKAIIILLYIFNPLNENIKKILYNYDDELSILFSDISKRWPGVICV